MIKFTIMPKIIVDSAEPLYRPKEAIELLGIGSATFWRWVKKGKIIALKLDGRILITKSEIERLRNERPNNMD